MPGTKARLLEFLRGHQILTLAVAGPYAAAVYYVVDGHLNLYFVTDPKTRHGAELLRDGQVAGTIQRDRQHWQEVRGVQFMGRCHRLIGRQRVAGWRLFLRRMNDLGRAQLAPTLSKVDLWRIEPDWMRLIDNSIEFGHKEEWRRAGGQARNG